MYVEDMEGMYVSIRDITLSFGVLGTVCVQIIHALKHVYISVTVH